MLCVLQGHKGELQQMYEDWPFFAATIDLIEMILAKADMRIAGLYDDVLVSDAAGKKLGNDLRQKFADTVRAICEVRRRIQGCFTQLCVVGDLRCLHAVLVSHAHVADSSVDGAVLRYALAHPSRCNQMVLLSLCVCR